MKTQGFSLIELLLVMMIVALLATFAYPSYRESITRARRLDGQTALLELAHRMEHYYAKEQSYQGATLGTGSSNDVQASNYSAQNWYRLAITRQTDSDFSLEAIPIGTQARDDKSCQTLSFNSFGVKGVARGPAAAPASKAEQCW